MVFIWANGEQRAHRIGSSIRGLHIQGERPYDVLISVLEIADYIRQNGYEAFKEYLHVQILPSVTHPNVTRRYYES